MTRHDTSQPSCPDCFKQGIEARLEHWYDLGPNSIDMIQRYWCPVCKKYKTLKVSHEFVV